jgi:FkbM family methyltransferase
MGLVTMRLSALVGPHGHVHAFEPNPKMSTLLAQSLEHNRIENVQLHRCALGAEPGELVLSIPRSNAGQATLVGVRSSDNCEKLKVPVNTLSEMIPRLKIAPVRLVKIDVEGFEDQVFQGADQWLTDTPPDAILFESNARSADGAVDPVMARLISKGFRIFAIPRVYLRMNFVEFIPSQTDIASLKSQDFLAVNGEKCHEILPKLGLKN